ncbi:inosine-uridine preferring nucleoside hydrolase [Flavobacteriaceae bacterium MAR_2009_75]|nr:inosine-uridine preferring nucleoside hydrolase [Flavobacteriaceae bacterium MAR_2009_75]
MAKSITRYQYSTYLLLCFILSFFGCKDKKIVEAPTNRTTEKSQKVNLIFDTDCNNELDDQHALAYLLSNGHTFNINGITVNATRLGGNIDEQYEEAERILQLYNLKDSIPLLRGANGNLNEILSKGLDDSFDGQKAVDFILDETRNTDVIILAVGKLTNIALALKKDSTLAQRTKVVWLGSNYPEPGEYNQNNDTIAMNYVLNSKIPFEMVTVRYGKPSGTDAVKVSPEEINQRMPGLGPIAKNGIIGRHGGNFTNFGDYSISLFKHIEYHTDPPTRSMFDMVAAAILKNKNWGESKTIPAPILINNKWLERPENSREITIWENFDKTLVMEDFYTSLQYPNIFKSKP